MVAWALQGASGATSPAAKITLHEFLGQATNGIPLVRTNVLLEPQWIGTVKRAYLRGGKGVYPMFICSGNQEKTEYEDKNR